MQKLSYGHWEHLAVRYSATTAWVLSTKTDKWVRLHPAEVFANGTVLTKAEFERRYPRRPRLPRHSRRA